MLSIQFFKRWSWATVVVIYLVIVAGGVVRTTGSGMGCPDWPKCFEQYIPPTDVSQLPADYKEKYAAKRQKKIERFAEYLDALGMNGKAMQLRTDESLLVEEDFNAAKTWTEYANRLVGALSGLFVLVTFVLSWVHRKKSFLIPILATLQIVVLLFQAWMGSIVVATNLLPWVLTVHMLLALAIVFLQLTLVRLVGETTTYSFSFKKYQPYLVVLLVLTLFQVVVGTQVRQEIDVVAKSFEYGSRNLWIENLSGLFEFHRSFAILMLLLNAVLVYEAFKAKLEKINALYLMGLILAVEVLAGIGLSYLHMPAALQPVHLVAGSVLFGVQAYLILFTKTQNA